MILRTLISGHAVEGTVQKTIVHPYDGTAPDAIEYADQVSIPPYEEVSDLAAFRVRVRAAAAGIAEMFEANQDALLAVACAETGSPIRYHQEDMEGAREFLRKLDSIEALLSPAYRFEPKGNVLLILSANEPVIEATVLVCSALYMGNTVFVKPSSKTPSFAHALVAALSGMPGIEGRIHCLFTDSAETERLIRLRAFDFVLSLGSRSTNKKLGIICAESEVEFLPESEGNDWAYVDKDNGSLEEVAALLVDSFVRHNGQMCNAVRGIIAHASVYEALVSEMKRVLAGVSSGSPHLPETQIGALLAGSDAWARSFAETAATQAEGFSRADTQDATVFPAMLIENPSDGSPIISESIFAPVLWVRAVEGHAEAISLYRMHNKHGLGFSVFSRDQQVVDECVARIRAGRLTINRHPLHIGLFDPLGGIRLSGRGGPSLWAEKCANRKCVAR